MDEKAHKTFYVQAYAIQSVHFIYGVLKKVAFGLNVNQNAINLNKIPNLTMICNKK